MTLQEWLNSSGKDSLSYADIRPGKYLLMEGIYLDQINGKHYYGFHVLTPTAIWAESHRSLLELQKLLEAGEPIERYPFLDDDMPECLLRWLKSLQLEECAPL